MMKLKDLLETMYAKQLVKIKITSNEPVETGIAKTLLETSEFLENGVEEVYISAIDARYISVKVKEEKLPNHIHRIPRSDTRSKRCYFCGSPLVKYTIKIYDPNFGPGDHEVYTCYQCIEVDLKRNHE